MDKLIKYTRQISHKQCKLKRFIQTVEFTKLTPEHRNILIMQEIYQSQLLDTLRELQREIK